LEILLPMLAVLVDVDASDTEITHTPTPSLSSSAQGTDSDMSTPCNSGMRFKSGRCIPDKMVPEVRALQRFQELQTKKEGQTKKSTEEEEKEEEEEEGKEGKENTVHVKPLFHASPLRNGPAGKNKDTSTAMEMDSAGNPVLYTAKELKEQEANNHDGNNHDGNNHGNTQTTALAPLSSITDFEREFRQLSFTTFVQEEDTLMTPPHHLGKCRCLFLSMVVQRLTGVWGLFWGCIGVVFWVVFCVVCCVLVAAWVARAVRTAQNDERRTVPTSNGRRRTWAARSRNRGRARRVVSFLVVHQCCHHQC